MFDELDNQPVAPGGVEPAGPRPVKTEDIFSAVDKTVKPEALKPRDSNYAPVPGTVIPADHGWLKNKLMIFALTIGGLIIVLGGGYLSLRFMVKNTAPADNLNPEIKKEEVNNNSAAPAVAEPAAEEINNLVNQPIETTVTQPVDTDQDGLTDEEEVALGTNSLNSDTDQDGLTDREEAKVYGTDPVKADTDQDGYPDGEEVKNGFNPKGPGKLLDINN